MSDAIIAEIQKRNAEEMIFIRGAIKRLGVKTDSGDYTVTFGQVFKDDVVANHCEGVAATLLNLKRAKMVTYDSPLLLQGAHDNVVVTLKAEFVPA